FADRVSELTAAPGRSLVGGVDFAAGGDDRLVDAANAGGDILLARSQGGDDEHQFVVTTTLAHSSSCGDCPLLDAYGVAQSCTCGGEEVRYSVTGADYSIDLT